MKNRVKHLKKKYAATLKLVKQAKAKQRAIENRMETLHPGTPGLRYLQEEFDREKRSLERTEAELLEIEKLMKDSWG